MQELGTHLLIDLWGIPASVLNDKLRLEESLVAAAKDSGAKVVDSRFSVFHPQGISGIVIIAESHVALHTWPEHKFAAIDVFTCGDPALARSICEKIIEEFQPVGHRVKSVQRGMPAVMRKSGVAAR